MTRYVFEPAAVRSLPIIGSDARFPVGRIFCVGRNYHALAIALNSPVDKATMRPFYFIKDASTVVESGATVGYPPGTKDYHYEMELVVAIGGHGFRVEEADAERLIYGYCAGLDMTRRDLHLIARDSGRPWELGKNFENSAVFAPIVPRGDLGVLRSGAIELKVNGITRQSSRLDKMIWGIPELIADLSRFYHLRPGDLIMTGTPEGIGSLKVGDRITGHIERVGEINLDIGPSEQGCAA